MNYSSLNMPKIGARVMLRGEGPYTVSGIRDDNMLSFSDRNSGSWKMWESEHYSACCDAPSTSPIREVTKRELVLGLYGNIEITEAGKNYVHLDATSIYYIADLRDAAKTLTEIADYLEAQ